MTLFKTIFRYNYFQHSLNNISCNLDKSSPNETWQFEPSADFIHTPTTKAEELGETGRGGREKKREHKRKRQGGEGEGVWEGAESCRARRYSHLPGRSPKICFIPWEREGGVKHLRLTSIAKRKLGGAQCSISTVWVLGPQFFHWTSSSAVASLSSAKTWRGRLPSKEKPMWNIRKRGRCYCSSSLPDTLS